MWEIQRFHELEFLMLTKLVAATDPSGSAAAAARLFPLPLGRPAIDELEDEIVADWESLTRPDLESLFRSAVDVVRADLLKIAGRKRSGEMEYQLVVPKKHADDWCSTLNQARIVLHERYQLPDEDEDFELDGGHERWLAIIQSEIYGAIMEFLVRQILWLK